MDSGAAAVDYSPALVRPRVPWPRLTGMPPQPTGSPQRPSQRNRCSPPGASGPRENGTYKIKQTDHQRWRHLFRGQGGRKAQPKHLFLAATGTRWDAHPGRTQGNEQAVTGVQLLVLAASFPFFLSLVLLPKLRSSVSACAVRLGKYPSDVGLVDALLAHQSTFPAV
jgi:hypothetical protein